MREQPENRRFDPDLASDLRRKKNRELAERLVQRARWLSDEDRALIEAVYGEGLSIAQLAPLTRQPSRTLRRRVRQSVQRVLSPRFVFVVHHMARWHPTRRQVAQACVLHGRSLREAAGDLHLTLHAVRRHVDTVDALYEATRS